MQPYTPISQLGYQWPTDVTQRYLTRGQKSWMTRDTNICTIGSCFAVNFSRWIKEQGVPVVSPPWGLHYNSSTIREELENASGQLRRDVIWEVEDAQTGAREFYDAKRHPMRAATRPELLDDMKSISEIGAVAIRQADAFIVTLGLSEIWEQRTETGWEILNRAPLANHKSALAPVRCRFQSVSEIVRDLSRIVEAIDRNSPMQRPVVLTVSPVPLKTTGSRYDPRISNLRSKSLLISAVHEYIDVAEKSGRCSIAYFPAFEQFLYHDLQEKIWQRDRRHIVAAKIDAVCRSFCEIFAVNPSEYPSLPNFEVPSV